MMLALILGQLSTSQPTSATLGRIWKSIEQAADVQGDRLPNRAFAERSWATVRPATFYGVEVRSIESRYRFRVPPDFNESKGPRGAIRVESYLDGFPVYGLCASGDEALARPLGFEYDADGYCINAQVSVRTSTGWKTPRLTRRGKTFLVAKLALFDNRYDDKKPTSKVPSDKLLWFKVVAEGFGTYSFYRDLTVVSPSGAICHLLPEQRRNLEDGLNGFWNREPPLEDTP